MPESHFELLVAGAGPAGIATAIAAVRAEPSLRGRVLVIDRARFPRPKPCGGGLTGRIDDAMAALGLRLTVPFFASGGAVVRYGQCSRTVPLTRPVRIVRREELDHSLVEQARAQGVDVREDMALTGFIVERGGVTAALGGGQPLRVRVLVGADGAGSLVRKALDEGGARTATLPPDPDRRFRSPRPRPIRLFCAELADRGWRREEMLYDFTPMLDGLHGYLWIFPVPGGRINVGLMHHPTVPRSGRELRALLAARLRDHGLELAPGVLRCWPAWGYQDARRVAAPHVLTVGDAAGIDALTGEGISVSLEQGAIAGAEIARGLGRGDLGFADYGRALRRAVVGRELSLDQALARMLYGATDHRRWLSLILHDDKMLDLYAARVSGSIVLADRKRTLVGALACHALHGRKRLRLTREAEQRAAINGEALDTGGHTVD